MTHEERIRPKFEALAAVMDERMTRLWAAAEARALGPGGASVVTRATSIRGKRIWMGRKDLDELGRSPPQDPPRKQRVRRPGAGRKPLTSKDPTLVKDLESLIEPVTRGDPESALRWTCKSTSKLAEALKQMGHEVGEISVRRLLAELGYSLQANAKVREGTSHPDRNAQFEYINAQAEAFLAANEPVISVDTKKRLGQRRHRPRYGAVRGEQHHAVVEGHGQQGVSGRNAHHDQRRQWREQRSQKRPSRAASVTKTAPPIEP